MVVGQQNPFRPAPAAGARHPVPLDVLARAVEITNHQKNPVARVGGDAVVDDVGVRLRAEAADHQHRDARRSEPADQLLAQGVLLRRDFTDRSLGCS